MASQDRDSKVPLERCGKPSARTKNQRYLPFSSRCKSTLIALLISAMLSTDVRATCHDPHHNLNMLSKDYLAFSSAACLPPPDDGADDVNNPRQLPFQYRNLCRVMIGTCGVNTPSHLSNRTSQIKQSHTKAVLDSSHPLTNAQHSPEGQPFRVGIAN